MKHEIQEVAVLRCFQKYLYFEKSITALLESGIDEKSPKLGDPFSAFFFTRKAQSPKIFCRLCGIIYTKLLLKNNS